MNTKHEFALYWADVSKVLTSTPIHSSFVIEDAAIVTRVVSVLRLKTEESFLLFDRALHATCTLQSISKKNITCKLMAKQANQNLTPAITFLLPVLKRDDLETALYSLVELGANVVQLVTTQKVQRAWGGQKEFDRLERIMIAAAEQSKNFAMPTLHEPLSLHAYLSKIPAHTTKIFFDVDGDQVLALLNIIESDNLKELFLMVGPEGDLTSEEKALLKSHTFTFCELTPTVLRAVQAVAVGLGMFRSVLIRR